MNTDRVIAIVVGGLVVALLAVIPSAVIQLSKAMRATDWDSAFGTVTAKTDITNPVFGCFTPTQRYSIVEYRFVGADGRYHSGVAHTPQGSERFPGAGMEVRFNRAKPSESLPAEAIEGYKKAHGGSLAVSLLLGVPLLMWARRRWQASDMRTTSIVERDARKSGTRPSL